MIRSCGPAPSVRLQCRLATPPSATPISSTLYICADVWDFGGASAENITHNLIKVLCFLGIGTSQDSVWFIWLCAAPHPNRAAGAACSNRNGRLIPTRTSMSAFTNFPPVLPVAQSPESLQTASQAIRVQRTLLHLAQTSCQARIPYEFEPQHKMFASVTRQSSPRRVWLRSSRSWRKDRSPALNSGLGSPISLPTTDFSGRTQPLSAASKRALSTHLRRSTRISQPTTDH